MIMMLAVNRSLEQHNYLLANSLLKGICNVLSVFPDDDDYNDYDDDPQFLTVKIIMMLAVNRSLEQLYYLSCAPPHWKGLH